MKECSRHPTEKIALLLSLLTCGFSDTKKKEEIVMLLQGEKKWHIQLSRPLNLLPIKTSDKELFMSFFFRLPEK